MCRMLYIQYSLLVVFGLFTLSLKVREKSVSGSTASCKVMRFAESASVRSTVSADGWTTLSNTVFLYNNVAPFTKDEWRGSPEHVGKITQTIKTNVVGSPNFLP